MAAEYITFRGKEFWVMADFTLEGNYLQATRTPYHNRHLFKLLEEHPNLMVEVPFEDRQTGTQEHHYYILQSDEKPLGQNIMFRHEYLSLCINPVFSPDLTPEAENVTEQILRIRKLNLLV